MTYYIMKILYKQGYFTFTTTAECENVCGIKKLDQLFDPQL